MSGAAMVAVPAVPVTRRVRAWLLASDVSRSMTSTCVMVPTFSLPLSSLARSAGRDGDCPRVRRKIRGGGDAPRVRLGRLVGDLSAAGPGGVRRVTAGITGEIGDDQFAAVREHDSRRLLRGLGHSGKLGFVVMAYVDHVSGVIVGDGAAVSGDVRPRGDRLSLDRLQSVVRGVAGFRPVRAYLRDARHELVDGQGIVHDEAARSRRRA